MAVSDRSRGWTLSQRAPGPTSRYDLQLAAIPLVFLVAAVLSVIVSMPIHAAMGIGSVLAGAVVLDGLFLNPPQIDDSS